MKDPIVDGRPGRGYDAFAFRPEDEALRSAFNAALAEVKQTPAFLAAMEPFGFTKDNLPDMATADPAVDEGAAGSTASGTRRPEPATDRDRPASRLPAEPARRRLGHRADHDRRLVPGARRRGAGWARPRERVRMAASAGRRLYRRVSGVRSLVVQLFWLYFVLPQLGLSLSAMTSAILGIGLNYGAYGAEIVRGAIQSVDRGQPEAARSLGLGRWQILRLVIVPQAMVIFVRPWGNLQIQLLKATSLVSLITIADLTYRAYQLNQLTMKTAEIFGLVLVAYFVMAQALAGLTLLIDARIGRWRLAGRSR